MRTSRPLQITALILAGCCLGASSGAQQQKPVPTVQPQGAGTPEVVVPESPKYLRKDEAPAQIGRALREAANTGRKVMIVVGGEWCPWCATLHRFYEQHPELAALRERNFVTVHVYYGEDDKNEKALAPYPAVLTVPYFLVVNEKGTLLESKRMPELDEAHKPDVEKFREFLINWTPAPKPSQAKK